MRKCLSFLIGAALMSSACTHINVNRGASLTPSSAPSTQTRKVNYLGFMIFEMQKASSASDACFPLQNDGFSIGMDAFDWLVSALTVGLYVQQTVTYRCSPSQETKKVSKNRS